MDRRAVLQRRLRSHRLSAPATTVLDAATHMLAVQAQEFWGGRWALGVRARGAPTVSDVDRAFDDGRLVRAWTMRGTLHIVPAADLLWTLSVTAERQLRLAAPRHRELGLDAAAFARAEALVRGALAGGGRLTRAEFAGVLAAGGVDPSGQRGIHVMQALALRGVVVLGPVVPRRGGPAREQHLVLAEDWLPALAQPDDPAAEMFARFIASHGPAGARDFAWWAGLPLGVARRAALAASDRLELVDEDPEARYVAAGAAPRRTPAAPDVLALPPFEEYYLSYADRTLLAEPEVRGAVGPGKNGIVRPVLVADGELVGTWTHSLAVGRHRERPVPELFASVDVQAAQAALDRYAAFITG